MKKERLKVYQGLVICTLILLFLMSCKELDLTQTHESKTHESKWLVTQHGSLIRLSEVVAIIIANIDTEEDKWGIIAYYSTEHFRVFPSFFDLEEIRRANGQIIYTGKYPEVKEYLSRISDQLNKIDGALRAERLLDSHRISPSAE